MTSSSPFWRQIWRLPKDAEESVSGALWSRGTVGLEIRDLQGDDLELVAYFEGGLPDEGIPGARLLSQALVPERDWMISFRQNAAPREIGRSLWVDMGEPACSKGPPPGRHVLRIPARTAFGTGSHESTRLLLEWLEDVSLEGRRVLDVGTGSGILALAALRLGAFRVAAFDIDGEAVLVARENSRDNQLAPLLWAGPSSSLASAASFDLVLVNVIPGMIKHAAPDICRHLSDRGELLLSGALVADEGDAVEPWCSQGLRLTKRRRDGEWIAFRLERP